MVLKKLSKWPLFFVIGCFMPGSLAYEMGTIHVLSSLNEPLEARIDIAERVTNDPVIVDLASKIDFMRHRVDRKYYISDLQASIEQDLQGKSTIRIKSNEPMISQNVDLLVMMLSSKGKSFGKYHFLLPQIRSTSQPPVVAANRLSTPWKKNRLLASKSKMKKKFGRPTVELISGQSRFNQKNSQRKVKEVTNKMDAIRPENTYSLASETGKNALSVKKIIASNTADKARLATKKHGFFERKDLQNLPSRKLFARLHGELKPELAVKNEESREAISTPIIKNKQNEKIQVAQVLKVNKEYKDIFNLDFYVVKPGDSLSAIAMKLKDYYPEIKSWKQLMEILAKDNPSAFVGKNINRIKVSAVLKIPERKKEPVMVARVLDLDMDGTGKYWEGYNREVTKQSDKTVIEKQKNLLNLLDDKNEVQLYKNKALSKAKFIKESSIAKIPVIPAYSYKTMSTMKLKKQNDKAFHLQELVSGSIL